MRDLVAEVEAVRATAEAVAEVSIPDEFLCPITSEVMRDPVITIADGLTYERKAIEKWLGRAAGQADPSKVWTSPLTGAPLGTPQLAPNVALRSQIIRFLEEHPECDA